MAIKASNNPGIDAMTAQTSPPLSGNFYAAEQLPACGAVRIDTDGKVYKSLGAALDGDAAIVGFVPAIYEEGDPVSIYGPDVVFQWDGTGTLVPGNLYFLGAAGGIDTAATLGDTNGAFYAVNTKNLLLLKRRGTGE